MIEIPESLRTVFTARVEERRGEYVLRIPPSQIENDAISAGDTYRVAITAVPGDEEPETATIEESSQRTDGPTPTATNRGPPVEDGEILDVTIETVGDQGDGIAKVDRGFVVIVPDAEPGEEPTVRIETVHENMAFAEIIEQDTGVEL